MTSDSIYDFGVSNEELLYRCKEKDEAALRELLRRHERPVYSLLYRMLGNHEDSEDALADVFMKVWRSASSFRGASKFTTWLYKIAGNTARDILRSRKVRPEVPVADDILCEMDLIGDNVVDPDIRIINADEIAGIEKAMMRLSEEDRLLVDLYHVQECSLDEISEIMGLKRSNLKVKLFRARRKLRNHLESFDRETSDELQSGAAESIGIQPGTTESA
ncbi:MAG: RNA polymerase sigma factor [Armatimonadota bacterium]